MVPGSLVASEVSISAVVPGLASRWQMWTRAVSWQERKGWF